MYIFKFTMNRQDDIRAERSLASIRVGLPIYSEDALIDVAIGSVTDGTPSRTFTIGWRSLAYGAAGVVAVNTIMGWLRGSIESMDEVLVNHFDPAGILGPKLIFVTCFIGHAIVAAIGKRSMRN